MSEPLDPGARQGRDLALAHLPFHVAIFASAAMPWYHGRSAFHDLGREGTGAFVGLVQFGMPLVASAITLSRALRGRTPQRASFVLASVPEIFKLIAAALAVLSILWRFHGRTEEVAAVAGVTALATAAGVSLVKGKRSEGWVRWSYLLAAMGPWHVFVAGVLFFELRGRHPEPGVWVYMLASAALFPLTARALWRRPASG